MLYPQLKFDQVKFHQDHVHPWSKFNTSGLKKPGLDDPKTAQWQDERDQLPNLQLMEGTTNQSKSGTAFQMWILTLGERKDYFLKSNFIPDNVSLQPADFEAFFAARKDLLRTKLKEVLTQSQ